MNIKPKICLSYSKVSEKKIKDLNFLDRYFFYPNIWQKILAFILLPLSCVYLVVTFLLKAMKKRKDLGIKIISVGNLVSGGSGKTPFSIALARFLESRYALDSNKDSKSSERIESKQKIEQKSKYRRICIILRGYKRKSKGLVVVKNNNKILCDVEQSGDEAMLIARSVHSDVIVCESRILAIEWAKNSGASVIILDDGYRFGFKKFDILLEPLTKPYFNFVLPSGYYRFPPSLYHACDLYLKEGVDYRRVVKVRVADNSDIDNKWACDARCDTHRADDFSKSGVKEHKPDMKMRDLVCKNYTRDILDSIESKIPRLILATAIANPVRIYATLPQNIRRENIVHRYFLSDHESFKESKLQNLLQQYTADYILMTQKDYVKCENFKIPIAILELEINVDSKVLASVEGFLKTN